jgi:hypothetical protein
VFFIDLCNIYSEYLSLYYINNIIVLRGEDLCHKKSLTIPLFTEVSVANQKVSIMCLCSGVSILPISTTSSVLLDFRTCLTIWYFFYFIFLSKTVLIHEVFVVEVTLKVCAKRQSNTSNSSRFIFIWCKICSFVSNVILLTHSFPLFFYHSTRSWSCPNWCDLKSVQLICSFKSVKLYVFICCHARLILEWHFV